MLIPLDRAIQQHQLQIRGIIHVGAHWGQEYEAYKLNGINDMVFIEPCSAAYKILEGRVGSDPNVSLFPCACGDFDGHTKIFVETKNEGQSNSILRPKKHLEYYPHIQFPECETIAIRLLDELPINFSKYNLLMMDTQGAELLVLKGATKALTAMDYIYTEVNDQELYEGNALVTELDEYLNDFKRVETHMVATQGWGDAIYVRRTLLQDKV